MASISASNESAVNAPVGIRRLALYGIYAVSAVCTVNVVVLIAGLELMQFPAEYVGGPFGPLAVGPVIVNSAVAAVGATLVYGIITRYAARPTLTFVIVSGVMLALSFAMFLAPDLAGAPLSVFTFLAVMHVTAALVIVGVLLRSANAEGSSR